MFADLLKLVAWIRKKTPASLKRALLTYKALGKSNTLDETSSYKNMHEYFDTFTEKSPPIYNHKIPLFDKMLITSFGLSFREWQIHFWLQKLPIPELGNSEIINSDYNFTILTIKPLNSQDKSLSNLKIAINFESPSSDNYEQWILGLKNQDIIWDINPKRTCFLEEMGLPAYWLDATNISNSWLIEAKANDKEYWGKYLGLSVLAPEQIMVLGHGGSELDRSLAKDYIINNQVIEPKIYYLPGWKEIIIANKLDSYYQARWLYKISSSLNSVVLMDSDSFFEDSFRKLFPSDLYFCKSPITSSELRLYLKGQEAYAIAEERRASSFEKVYIWETSLRPKIAVLISLYNYESRIRDALESVANQTQSNIELIVVDDGSSDQGLNVVQDWMENTILEKSHPFVRLLLIRHQTNFGLAAARNTAFAEALSEWCFVLDADNELFPNALRSCYGITQCSSEQLAVVHPLLLVEAENGREDDDRSLVGLAPWQKHRLMHENTIDAMALVRHSAWKLVGGYTHIDGGWEDYDFWCKLIDQGFFGIQCPEILAVYRSHKKSMSHIYTNTSWRSLSRTLKKRHPWMQPRALE